MWDKNEKGRRAGSDFSDMIKFYHHFALNLLLFLLLCVLTDQPPTNFL
jgi:hypothetical protein